MKHGLAMAITSLFILAACSGNSVKNTLGLDRGAPDEFRVVSRPPLSVPPQFTLRPPGSTPDTATNQLPTSKQAEAIMTGSTPAAEVTPVSAVNVKPAPAMSGSAAESAFLKNIGVAQADPDGAR